MPEGNLSPKSVTNYKSKAACNAIGINEEPLIGEAWYERVITAFEQQ